APPEFPPRCVLRPLGLAHPPPLRLSLRPFPILLLSLPGRRRRNLLSAKAEIPRRHARRPLPRSEGAGAFYIPMCERGGAACARGGEEGTLYGREYGEESIGGYGDAGGGEGCGGY
ncbi:hypothetical protein O988_09356, partial [Pseudogymnoascus sp. VKM F-3808]